MTRTRLLGDQVVSVDKHQTAGVQRHRPPTGRVSEMLTAVIDAKGVHLTEILDDDTTAFRIGVRIDPYARIDRQLPAGLGAVAPGMFEHCPTPTNRSLCATASTPPLVDRGTGTGLHQRGDDRDA